MDMNGWNLEGKTALITGGTKGIGKAINEEFLELGAKTIIVSRSKEDIEQLVSDYQKRGLNCHGIAADVGTEEGRREVVEFSNSHFDSLNVLVNNAGINIRKSTQDYSLDDLHKIMAVNVESSFDLSRKLYSRLKSAGNGSVINISSITSMSIVGTSTAGYHMSKGAMDRLNDFLAVEWGKDNIRVNAIHPWYIATPLGKEILKVEAKRKKIVDSTPMGRVGEPEEVASIAAFLAMDKSSYVSGSHITVDGAFSKVGVMPQ
jgi:NAD(P)-dependent dehydrogenase (short-subunit alcohol dehydrogenase family)